MKKVITILIIALISAHSMAQAQNCLWVKSAGGTGYDAAGSVSTDANGNVYIVGVFGNPDITFGLTTLTNVGGFDIFITKYDSTGNLIWAKSAGGTFSESCLSVTNDDSGNVYISGYFTSPTITFGSTTLINADNSGNSCDIFIAKYDAGGNVLWAKSAGGSVNDFSYSISTDDIGNIYMSGAFTSSNIAFDSIVLANASNSGIANIFIAKYDANGNVLWAKSTGGTYPAYGASVTTDVSGYLYISGEFSSPTITFGSITLTNANNTGNYQDFFIAKYDSVGNVVWAKSAGGNDLESCIDVSCDDSGNLFMVGRFDSPSLNFGSTTLINSGNSDIFIGKYDSNGNLLWVKSAGGTNSDFGYNISTDSNGNAYITGKFKSSAITFGSTTLTNMDTAGTYDIFIAKYDASGNEVWAKSEGGTSNEEARSVSTDANSNLYITGYFESPNITIGTNYLTNAGNAGIGDIFIAKYSGIITDVNEMIGKNDITISPNPTNSAITLTIPKPIKTIISITNLTGKQVATYYLQNTAIKTIDLSNLAEGVYFVSIKSDEGVVTKKIVKQ